MAPRSINHRPEATGVEIDEEGDLAAPLHLTMGSGAVIKIPTSARSVEAWLECDDFVVGLVLVAGAG